MMTPVNLAPLEFVVRLSHRWPILNAKKKRDEIDAEMRKHSDVMAKMPRGAMNLITDEARATPEYKTAKAGYDTAFSRLKNFNSAFVKTFDKEIKAERKAKYG